MISRDGPDPLLDLLVEVTPPVTYTLPSAPALVTNLSANEYVGRMAVGRIWNGPSGRPASRRRGRR
jgi:predicted membrane GTPase involved in stress response